MSTAYDDRRPEDRRPEDIEEDIERTRSQIGGTLEELERRLSPDRLADQLVDYLRGPNEFGANLARQVKANPIPVALIGIGIAWLLLAGRDARPRRAVPMRDEGYPAYPYDDEYDEYEAYDDYAAANAYDVVGRPRDDPYRAYDDRYEEGSYDADGVHRGYRGDRDAYGAYEEDEDVTVGRPRAAATSASVYDDEKRTATDPLTTGEPTATRTTTTEQRPLTGERTGA